MAFARNVFVNCPFDRDFYPLLRPLLFTIIYLGLKPRIALEDVDSGQSRIDKIVALIASSKYAIHDLSRIKAQKAGDLFRLNMPFELGIDVGCRLFGSRLRAGKKCLVLEAEPYRYNAAISDLSGSDISYHGNEPDRIVGAVRNWLQNVCGLKKPPGPAAIVAGGVSEKAMGTFLPAGHLWTSRVDCASIPAVVFCVLRNHRSAP